MYVILVYDIAVDGNGQRRWRKVYQICKQYLVHIQNSVFEGEITESNLFQLERELQTQIRDDKDSVIIFRSRHERWMQKSILGLYDEPSNFI